MCLAAEAVETARAKRRKAAVDAQMPRPQILLQMIENASAEFDGGIRDLTALAKNQSLFR